MNGSLQINPKHVINHQKNLYKSFKRDKVKKGQKGQKVKILKMLEIVRNMCKINISSENVNPVEISQNDKWTWD